MRNIMQAFGNRSCRVPAISLAVLLLGVPLGAGQDPQPEVQGRRLPGWSFTPSIALGATYDTNVALSSPRADLGETQGDSLFNVVPGGQLEYTGRRTDFSTTYRGFLRRYLEVQGLNSFDQRATLGLKHLVSKRLTFHARDRFADSPTTDEVEVNAVPFRRVGSRMNTFSAGADYQLRKFTTWSARYDMTWVAFDEPDQFLTGGTIHGVQNELVHQLSERVSTGGEYGYRTASLNEGGRELSFQDAGGVLRLRLGRHTTASAAGGFALLHDRSLDETRTGPYLRLSLTQDLARATVGAAFARHYVPSFGFGGASNNQELRGFVLMPVAGRVYTQTSAAWRRSVPFEEASLELDTMHVSSTVGFAAARWARVEALYTYARQDSIITGGEIDRHRVGVQLIVSQPMRIR